MKKFFKYLGLITFLCGSFIYTEKTASVVKELDDIMIQIKTNKDNYYVEKKEAIIDGDTIIPGINGIEVNVNKSYQVMRTLGLYSENALAYNEIEVTNSLDTCKDKYIINGNLNKHTVSLLFIVEKENNIDNIINILKMKKTLGNFFIDGLWLENSNDKVYDIINNNYLIGSIGYNYDYNDISYPWLDNIIKKLMKTKNSYCFKGINSLNKCSNNNNFTISTDIIEKNQLIETKNIIKNGSILTYKINSNLEKELPLIIDYIYSKGFDISRLDYLLKE